MAKIAKCYYLYNNEKFDSKDDLYFAVLGNMEAREGSFVGLKANANPEPNKEFEKELPKGIAPPKQGELFTFESKKEKKKLVIKGYNNNNKTANVSTYFQSVGKEALKIYPVKDGTYWSLYSESGYIFPLKGVFRTQKELLAYVNANLENLYNDYTPETKNRLGLQYTDKQLDIINKIRESTKNMVLDEVLGMYVNLATNKRFKRVSNAIGETILDDEGNVVVIDNPYGPAALRYGNAIDDINRDLMNDSLLTFEEYQKVPRTNIFPDKKKFDNYINQISEFKFKLEARGEMVITNDGNQIILSDNESGIAGAVDLMTVDAEGLIRIYDYKTMRGNQHTEMYKGLPMYDKVYPNSGNISNRQKHTKQQSYYKALFEKQFKTPVESISIVSIELPKYTPTSTLLQYAEVDREVQLTPVDVNLNKTRPDIAEAKSFEEFIEGFNPTDEQLDEAESILTGDFIRTVVKTKQGDISIRAVDEGTNYMLIRLDSENNAPFSMAYEGIKILVAKDLAYKEYLNSMLNLIEDNTINEATSIVVDLPQSEEETDDLLTIVFPDRSNDAITKGGNTFLAPYFKGNRLDPNMTNDLIQDMIANKNKKAHTALLRVFAKNSEVFKNLPFIFDSNLPTAGRVSMDKVQKKPIAIYLNPNLIKNNTEARKVLMEEMLHALIYNELRSGSESAARLTDLMMAARANFGEEKFKAMAEMEKRFNVLRQERLINELTADEQAEYDSLANNKELIEVYYKLKNIDEFAAGAMLSQGFQNYLKSIDTNKDELKGFKSILDKIMDLFAKMLGYTSKDNPLLTLAIYDVLVITDSASEKVRQNPDMLDVVGTHRKTTMEIDSMFQLRDENGHLNKIENGEDVATFINLNVHNVVALYDEATQTIKTGYGSTFGLNAEQNLTDDEDDSDQYEDNEEGTAESATMSQEEGFKERIKSYLVNLKQRDNTLYKSLRAYQDNDNLTEDQFREYAIKREVLEKERAFVKQSLNNVTNVGDINIKRLSQLKEQALVELDNIEDFLNNPTGMNEKDIKYALETTKFWLSSKNLLFKEKDFSDKLLIESFNELEVKAKLVDEKLLAKLEDWVMNELVNKKTNNKLHLTNLLEELKDTGKLAAEVNDIGVINNPIFQALSVYIKERDVDLSRARFEKIKAFEDIVKSAAPILSSYSNGSDRFEIFRQLDNFGNKTMNMVNRFSSKYQQERKVLNYPYRKDNNGKDEAYQGLQFLQEQTELFNLQALLPEKDEDFDKDAYDAEEKRLKDLLGINHYMDWMNDQTNKIKQYKRAKESRLITLMNEYGVNTEEDLNNIQEAGIKLSVFEQFNSPYNMMKFANNDNITENPFTLKGTYQNAKYIADIPKKDFKSKDGEAFNFNNYDSKFEIIERNVELKALYDSFQDIMSYVGDLIPYGDMQKLSKGSIPEFKKSMFGAFKTSWKGGMNAFRDSMIDMIRTEKYEGLSEGTDVITGKAQRKINLGIASSKEKIREEMFQATFDYFQKTGKTMPDEMQEETQSKLVAKYAEEAEFDLSKVFRMYLALGMAYENNAEMEDTLILTQLMFEKQKEFERTNKGDLKVDPAYQFMEGYKTKELSDSFVQQRRILDHNNISILYNDKRDIKSTRTKIYTAVEKKHLKMYEEQLTWVDEQLREGNIKPEQGVLFKARIEKYKDNLGAYGDTEKYIDMPIKWTQYTGMGWNWIGGISNMLFGTSSNLVEAAGEEFYDKSELLAAYQKVMHSVARNLTFNLGTTKEAEKIRSLMDIYDIMAESGKEYKDLIGGDFTERLKALSAFNANARTEYVNQAPLMIVMLNKTKFTYNGEEFSLYDAFGVDGTWDTEKYGEYPKELVAKTITKVKALIQRNHGNYNPLAPMLAKRTGVGRLLLQFRSWMVEGYRTRMGDRDGREDAILETTVKGRYISAWDVYKSENAVDVTKAMIMQIIRNFIPIKNAFGSQSNPIDSYFKGNTNVKAVDIANMKRLAMELNMLIAAYIVGVGLKSLAGDWDDDDMKKKAATLFINQATRMRTDVLMYANPVEAMKLLKDPVPALKTLTGITKLGDSFKKLIIDGEPEYEAGIYKGHNRVFKNTMEITPFTNMIYKTISNTSQQYDDK